MDKIVEYTMNFEKALALHGLGLFLYFFDFRYETAGLFDYNGFGGRFKYLTFIIKVSENEIIYMPFRPPQRDRILWKAAQISSILFQLRL